MKKVITYGTYDLLHRGHIRLLERAKALGDYLIVGVTAEDFDKVRGKINVQQSLMERVAAVEATGIADKVIIEEYEGQKIDDIKRYDIDIFTVGSDWTGFFDYLKEYCDVVYLDRTEGVSSTDLRSKNGQQLMGFIGDNAIIPKHIDELSYVNGMQAAAVFTENERIRHEAQARGLAVCDSLDELFDSVDSVYVASDPTLHRIHVERSLEAGKDVLCEMPIALNVVDFDWLTALADEKGLVLMDGLKTAYSTAYHRLKLLVKSGRIGNVVSIKGACTSLRDLAGIDMNGEWNSICTWGPTALLPVFQLLGCGEFKVDITSKLIDGWQDFDVFSKIDLYSKDSVASIQVGNGVKSEGDLVVSGTKGYIYVPAPWWKTDYFEVRFEDPSTNRRYFYQLNGEGIRYEFVCFHRAVEHGEKSIYLERETSRAIVSVLERFYRGERYEMRPYRLSESDSRICSSLVGTDGVSSILA